MTEIRGHASSADEPASRGEAVRDLGAWRATMSEQREARFEHVDGAWLARTASTEARVDAFGEVTYRGTSYAPPEAPKTGKGGRERWARPEATRTTEVRLDTLSVERGARSLSEGRVQVEGSEDGDVFIQRGQVRETWSTLEGGVRQSWELDAKPAGKGDVVVTVAIMGGRYERTTDAGLVFVDEHGARFFYGHGLWIDANGVRHAVPVELDGDNIRLRVPAEVVEASTYPAILDPIVGSSSSTASYSPHVASSGGIHAAVWESYASGVPRIQYSFFSDADGAFSSTIFNKFVSTTSYQAEPTIAYDGTQFVVVWRDKRTGASNLRVARIGTNGTVLSDLAVAASSTDQYTPALSCISSTSCLITWHETPASLSRVRGVTYNPSTGTRSAPFTISADATNHDYASAVANDGTSYFVAWERYSDSAYTSNVYGRTVGAGGLVGDTVVGIATSGLYQYTPTIGYDGSSYVVGYTQWDTDEDAKLQRVTATAVSGAPLALASGAGSQGYASFARRGSTFYVSYMDSDNVKVKTLDVSTLSSASSVASEPVSETLPMVSAGTSSTMFVYNRRTGSEWRSYGARLASSTVSSVGELRVGPPRCDSLSTSALPSGTQAIPGQVVITATANCVGGTAEYEFYLQSSGSYWTRVQSFGPTNTFTWNTASYGSGTYQVQVRVRRAGVSAAYEQVQQFGYTLTGGAGTCNAVAISTSPASTASAGTAVTITGAATCTNGATPVYQFYRKSPSGLWTLVRDWGSSGSVLWDTTGASTGTHDLQVRARSSVSSASFESIGTTAFGVTGGTESCASVAATLSPAAPQTVGTPVTITASSSCSSPGAQYQFYSLAPGGYWTLLQAWSSNNVVTWTAAGQPTGTHSLQVRVKHASSSAPYDAIWSATYQRN